MPRRRFTSMRARRRSRAGRRNNTSKARLLRSSSSLQDANASSAIATTWPAIILFPFFMRADCRASSPCLHNYRALFIHIASYIFTRAIIIHRMPIGRFCFITNSLLSPPQLELRDAAGCHARRHSAVMRKFSFPLVVIAPL